MSAFPSLSVQLIVSVLLCPVWFCSGYRGLEFTSCRPLPLKPLHYTPPPLLFLSVSSFFSFLSWLVEAQQLVHIHCRRLGAMWHYALTSFLKLAHQTLTGHHTSYHISSVNLHTWVKKAICKPTVEVCLLSFRQLFGLHSNPPQTNIQRFIQIQSESELNYLTYATWKHSA